MWLHDKRLGQYKFHQIIFKQMNFFKDEKAINGVVFDTIIIDYLMSTVQPLKILHSILHRYN